jgi:DNA invertase Pin-like site-specific DNA recombinase
MAVLGYARTSTLHQSLDQQLDALRDSGAEKIFTDQMSGAQTDRPGLSELLAYAQPGDTVTVVALDRLGRSLTGVIGTIDLLQERKIILKSLREGVDFGTSVGRMIAGIFASLAEYERTLINERAAAAREARALRGKPVGRPRKLDDAKLRQAQALRASGETVAEVCALLGVGRATLYRALAS